MTREEAKEIFLNRGYVNGLFDGDKWRESIVVISKWLEQEPCEDCISREAVLALKTPVDTMTGWSGYMIDALDVEQLPSIQPKQKTDVLDKIRAEIEQVKSIMNEEIINHDRKDLINFVNGLNQSLVIIDKYKAESEG